MSIPTATGGLRRTAAGLSLVELLISMALGVFLAGGTISVYVAARQQFHHDDQLARIQENGRYALTLIGRELAMSGFYAGLVSSQGLYGQRVGVDCNSQGWALFPEGALDLVDNHRGSGVPTTLSAAPLTCIDGSSVVEDSDLLAVKRSASSASLLSGALVPGATSSGSERWYLETVAGVVGEWRKLRPGDLAGLGQANPSLSLWEARAGILYLRKYSQYRGDNTPTLCIEKLVGDDMLSRCFVEGIEDLQVELGVDLDADGAPDVYRMNPSATDIGNAVVARVFLLVRSQRPVPGYGARKSFYLGKREVQRDADGYLRRVFSTTVRLQSLYATRYARVVP